MNEYARPHTALQQLIAVHDHFRGYLSALRSAVDGADPAHTPPLADLRAYCLYFCRGLTTHHLIEDRQWFPALRRDDPGLAPVIDRLEAEHHKVAAYLTRIEDVANTLAEPDGEQPLVELRAELSRLATELLAHLAYEEEALAEALAIPYEPH